MSYYILRIKYNIKMKILLKTLKNASYEVEVEGPNSTVLDVKKSAESKLNADSASIKLVFNGNVLVDDKSLSFYNIKENSVIVTMTTKVNSTVKKTDVVNTEISIEDNKKQVKESLKNMIQNQNISNQNGSNQNNNQQSQSNNNKSYEDQVVQLLEMGFDKSQCEKAIIAAQGSIPIAIEYLYSGIPQNLGLNNNNNVNVNNNNVNPLLSSDDIDADLDAYINGHEENNNVNNNEIDSEFLNNIDLQDPNAISKIASVLKIIVKQDPMLLQEILMDIEENSPQIINFIKDNETLFKAEMDKPISEDDYKLYDSLVGSGLGGGEFVVEGEEDEGEEDEDNGEDPFKEIIKDFTPEDNKIIEKLVSMGFSRGDAIQAYIACDKNEQNATNFLLQDKYN